MPSELMEEILEEEVDEDQVAVWWLGQASFIYKFDNGATVAVDPYLSESAPRMLEPPIEPEDLEVDLILCSHDHLDHFDHPAFRYFLRGNPDCLVLGPASVHAHYFAMNLPLDQFEVLNRGEEGEFCGLNIRAVFAEHDSGRARDAVGFVIDGGNVRVYQTGDSLFNEHLLLDAGEIAPDLLVVPINGRLGNMNADEAANLADTVKPTTVIPMHYGMFERNTVDPQTFLDAAEERELSSEIVLLEPGEMWLYEKEVD